MTILDRRDLFFAHHQLTGSAWGQPERYSFAERVAAVAHAGCTGIGFEAQSLRELLATTSAAEITAVLDDHGVRIGELEVLTWWWGTPDDADASRAGEEQMYSLADTFGIPRLKASAMFLQPQDRPELAVLAERFAALCDRAAEHGVRIALEPVSVFEGFDYADAATVLLEADHPNGGLMLDCWHFFRDSSGFDALARLRGEHIAGLELVDGAAEPQGSLMADSIEHRMLPGQGAFDLERLIGELDRLEPQVQVAVEVLSAELRQLTLFDNTERSVAAVAALRDRVGSAAPAVR